LLPRTQHLSGGPERMLYLTTLAHGNLQARQARRIGPSARGGSLGQMAGFRQMGGPGGSWTPTTRLWFTICPAGRVGGPGGCMTVTPGELPPGDAGSAPSEV